MFKDGQKFTVPPISDRREVDFGSGETWCNCLFRTCADGWAWLHARGAQLACLLELAQGGARWYSNSASTALTIRACMHAGLGRKGIYLYNLPETISAYKYLQVPSVSARFGTDPFFWNWAMWLTARLIPRNLLNDRNFVKGFAALSDPLVRTVDKWAGETVVRATEHGICSYRLEITLVALGSLSTLLPHVLVCSDNIPCFCFIATVAVSTTWIACTT